MSDFHKHADGGPDHWAEVPELFRTSSAALPSLWQEIFGPLRTGAVDDLVVVGQVGQSLDGRIATVTGNSHYINGADGLAHLHRLRALMDAVVVGVGTAVADDPQLTVRRVSGPHPARVVIDPHGRLPPRAKLLLPDGTRRLIVTSEGTKIDASAGVEIAALPVTEGRIAPAAILAALAARGLRRILIEGGAATVSRFLADGCLDRLHVIVAPAILGSGRPGIELPAVERANDALRPQVRSYPLGTEVLFDCDLSAHRVPVGRAKKSA